MKYEFIEKDIDTTILKYKEKEYEFKSTLSLTSKIQNYIKLSRTKMIIDLSKQGMTVEDLIITRTKNGKTYRDETNKIELEQQYMDSAINDVIDEICEEIFGLKIADLIIDIGLESEEEAATFGSQLFNRLMGKTPRENK